MKYRIIPLSLALAALLLGMLVGCGVITRAASATTRPYTMARLPLPLPSHPRILVVGDSITVGYYATTQAEDYVSLLTGRLGGSLVDYGKYGSTVTDALGELQATPPGQADLIIVELGTNDTESNFSDLYAQLLNIVLKPSPSAQLVCAGPWQSYDTQHDTIAADVKSLCEGGYAQGHFVDLQALYYYDNPTFDYHGPAGRLTWLGAGDWFHPNSPGHTAIAQAIETALGV